MHLYPDIIKFNCQSRFNYSAVTSAYNSVDGVGFSIQVPSPFSLRWFSHQFNRAGLQRRARHFIKKFRVDKRFIHEWVLQRSLNLPTKAKIQIY